MLKIFFEKMLQKNLTFSSLAVCANLTWELSLLDYVDSKFHEK